MRGDHADLRDDRLAGDLKGRKGTYDRDRWSSWIGCVGSGRFGSRRKRNCGRPCAAVVVRACDPPGCVEAVML